DGRDADAVCRRCAVLVGCSSVPVRLHPAVLGLRDLVDSAPDGVRILAARDGSLPAALRAGVLGTGVPAWDVQRGDTAPGRVRWLRTVAGDLQGLRRSGFGGLDAHVLRDGGELVRAPRAAGLDMKSHSAVFLSRFVGYPVRAGTGSGSRPAFRR